MLNRGKTSIALDLKADPDRAKLTELIKRADILVEQFRPGVMSRLGLGYEDLRALNRSSFIARYLATAKMGHARMRPVTTSTISATLACWICSLGHATIPWSRRCLPPTSPAEAFRRSSTFCLPCGFAIKAGRAATST